MTRDDELAPLGIIHNPGQDAEPSALETERRGVEAILEAIDDIFRFHAEQMKAIDQLEEAMTW